MPFQSFQIILYKTQDHKGLLWNSQKLAFVSSVFLPSLFPSVITIWDCFEHMPSNAVFVTAF